MSTYFITKDPSFNCVCSCCSLKIERHLKTVLGQYINCPYPLLDAPEYIPYPGLCLHLFDKKRIEKSTFADFYGKFCGILHRFKKKGNVLYPATI